MSAKETTAALKETYAAAQDLKGWIGWLKIYVKEEKKQRKEYFWRLVIACALGAFGASVFGNILRILAENTIEHISVWWAG